MKINMKVWVILILTLFLLSCELPFAPQAGAIVGRGIQLQFIDYPTGELEEGEPFAITLQTTNNAPHDVEGTLCLLDTPADRFGGIPSGSCEDLFIPAAVKIDKYFEPQTEVSFFPGGEGLYYYHSLNPNIKQSTSISAMLRYAVETTSSATVCIKQQRIKDDSRLPSGCQAETTLTNIKQPNTPIEVTKIEKKASSLGPDQIKLTFIIHLQKVEDGLLLPRESIYEPTSSEERIEFSAGFFNGQTFECSPTIDNKIDFREKQKVIKCRTIVTLQQEYIQEPLEIILGYGFQKTASIPEIDLVAEDMNLYS